MSKAIAEATKTQAGVSNFLSVPDEDMFMGDYLPSQEIEEMAAALIEQYPQFHVIAENGYRITYLWKSKGGKSKGRLRRGQCQKLTGLPYYFGETDFVIWLAADHLRDRPNFNFRRLVFHELKHIAVDENGQATCVGHEFEGFVDEVEEFGIWDEGMKPLAEAFQQHLFT
jgi:hypothetical protein